jgi:phytoene synthase
MNRAQRGRPVLVAPASPTVAGAVAPRPEQVLATHARTSFNFAARFLPPPQRRAATDLYAFFRTLDDLVDESLPAHAASIRAELDAWRAWFDGSLRGRAPREPLGHDLARAVDAWRVPVQLFQHMLDGLESDLGPRELESDAELHTYCYQVASTVGCAMAHVLGATSPTALSAAERLGHAMQLTNILRDVGEDLDAGRVYLPRTLLAEHGLCRDDLLRMRHDQRGPDERYRTLLGGQVARAHALYAQAIPAIWLLPSECRLPILLAARLYRRLLDSIARQDYDTLRRRAATTRFHKAQEAAIAFVLVKLWCYGEQPAQVAPLPVTHPAQPVVEVRVDR